MNAKAAVPILALLSMSAALAAEKDIITKSFDAAPGGHLYMKVDRGSIHVTSSDSDKVGVKVVRELKHASDARAAEVCQMHKIVFSEENGTVKIEADNPNTRGFFRKNPFNQLQVDYSISIPRKFNIDVNTAGGNIDISPVEGDVKCRTSGGNLNLGAIKGPVEARTSGGNIALASAHGDATLHTSGGVLHIGEVEGDLIAQTSGGSITLERVRGSSDVQTSGGNIRVMDAFGPVSAHTSGGNVSAQLSQQPATTCALKTSGGNVSVTLAANIAVTVDAHTSGGTIRSDFPGELNKQKTRLLAQLNGGGPGLVLQTSGGNVEIRKK
jgi:DUF4097 and DUF4098 domain-containing protein YvlB